MKFQDTLENAFFTEDRLPPDDTIAPCPEVRLEWPMMFYVDNTT